MRTLCAFTLLLSFSLAAVVGGAGAGGKGKDLPPAKLLAPDYSPPDLKLAKAKDQIGPLAADSGLWKYLRAQLKAGEYERGQLKNGRRGRERCVELPGQGALLIGFCTEQRPYFMNYLQPIYVTADGEALGQARGKPRNVGDILVVKAKPGYAVGKINLRVGDLFDGLRVTFMKVTETGLDLEDRYESPWIGNMGGGDLSYGGDGSFIVGFHGLYGGEAPHPTALTTMATISIPAKKG